MQFGPGPTTKVGIVNHPLIEVKSTNKASPYKSRTVTPKSDTI
jgi:hypothetical protein